MVRWSCTMGSDNKSYQCIKTTLNSVKLINVCVLAFGSKLSGQERSGIRRWILDLEPMDLILLQFFYIRGCLLKAVLSLETCLSERQIFGESSNLLVPSSSTFLTIKIGPTSFGMNLSVARYFVANKIELKKKVKKELRGGWHRVLGIDKPIEGFGKNCWVCFFRWEEYLLTA